MVKTGNIGQDSCAVTVTHMFFVYTSESLAYVHSHGDVSLYEIYTASLAGPGVYAKVYSQGSRRSRCLRLFMSQCLLVL